MERDDAVCSPAGNLLDALPAADVDHLTYTSMNWETYRLFHDGSGGLFALDWDVVTHDWGGNL